MDILKKASSALKQCFVTAETVNILGKEYNGKQIVKFPVKLSKDYNLSSIILFFQNSELPLKEYVVLCKNENILPISYVDKSLIKSAIESYASSDVHGFFIKPKYERELPYEVVSSTSKSILIVPDSITAKINIGNIEKLLKEGVLESIPYNPLWSKEIEFTIANSVFNVISNCNNLNQKDWRYVKGVFVDSGDFFNNNNFIEKIPKSAKIFTISDEKFKSIRILLKNNVVKNIGEIVSAIKD